jgi:hypothetical protein
VTQKDWITLLMSEKNKTLKYFINFFYHLLATPNFLIFNQPSITVSEMQCFLDSSLPCSHTFRYIYARISLYFPTFPFFIVVLGGGTMWHFQKFLQYIKYIILEFSFLHHSPLFLPPPIPTFPFNVIWSNRTQLSSENWQEYRGYQFFLSKIFVCICAQLDGMHIRPIWQWDPVNELYKV